MTVYPATFWRWYRTHEGARWHLKIGTAGAVGLKGARELAMAAVGRGEDPAQTVQEYLDEIHSSAA